MIKKILIALILISPALILSSCFEPSPPKAEFLDYEITNVTLQGIQVSFYFDVENPNPLPIDISKYSYQVFINDREFLSENRAGFNLPANGKKKITIPVNLRYEQVFGTALSVLELIARGEETISYRIQGSISVGTMGITASTPLKASGTIPLPKDINL
jgi:LEA14-like dessication related protein